MTTRPLGTVRSLLVCLLLCLLPLQLWAAKVSFAVGPLAGIDGVFDALPSAAEPGPDVVCVLCTRNPDTIRAALKEPPGQGYMAYLKKVTSRVGEASGLPVILNHYAQLGKENLDRTGIRALVVIPMDRRISLEWVDRLLELLRETHVPTLGICGGCQHLARAYGGIVNDIRPLWIGETDPNPNYQPGFFKEWGPTRVRITRRDPLFEGLPDEISVEERHHQEVKRLPRVFRVLATSDTCHVQAIKHRTKLQYGTQFHPEHYDAAHPAGATILRNFFHLVATR
jgi:GMP synthase-like glutamine amidotransferase